MSTREWFGLAVLGIGSLFGFMLGGMYGLGLATLCLVVGFVLVVASTALGPIVSTKTSLLVLVKEVHARPQSLGKFREVRDPDQPDLQFEIFVHCWLVNDADQPLSLSGLEVSLAKPDGSSLALQPIRGDLDGWTLGRLRDELDSWGVRYLEAAQEKMQDLDVTRPVEGGATREGWLHLRAESITPRQLRGSSITVTVLDSAAQKHIGTAKGPHQIPGRVWPLVGHAGEPASASESSPENRQRLMEN